MNRHCWRPRARPRRLRTKQPGRSSRTIPRRSRRAAGFSATAWVRPNLELTGQEGAPRRPLLPRSSAEQRGLRGSRLSARIPMLLRCRERRRLRSRAGRRSCSASRPMDVRACPVVRARPARAWTWRLRWTRSIDPRSRVTRSCPLTQYRLLTPCRLLARCRLPTECRPLAPCRLLTQSRPRPCAPVPPIPPRRAQSNGYRFTTRALHPSRCRRPEPPIPRARAEPTRHRGTGRTRTLRRRVGR